NGIGSCWNAETGKQTWQKRLGGNFSASPVYADGHIYISSEEGKTSVFKANPKKCEIVAENQLGDETFSTLAISGGKIFLRSASSASGKRQETLYCIGK